MCLHQHRAPGSQRGSRITSGNAEGEREVAGGEDGDRAERPERPSQVGPRPERPAFVCCVDACLQVIALPRSPRRGTAAGKSSGAAPRGSRVSVRWLSAIAKGTSSSPAPSKLSATARSIRLLPSDQAPATRARADRPFDDIGHVAKRSLRKIGVGVGHGAPWRTGSLVGAWRVAEILAQRSWICT